VIPCCPQQLRKVMRAWMAGLSRQVSRRVVMESSNALDTLVGGVNALEVFFQDGFPRRPPVERRDGPCGCGPAPVPGHADRW
jgi:hypothetical protein